MSCDILSTLNPAVTAACSIAKWGAKKTGDSAFDSIVGSFSDGAGWIVKELTTGWLGLPSPHLDPDSQTGPVWFLRDSTAWLTSAIAVLCLLIAAGRMVWERKSEPAKTAAAGLLRLVVVSGASVGAINLLSKASDSFSIWIVNRSTGCSAADQASSHCVDMFGQRVLALTAFGGTSAAGQGLILLLALLIMISSLIQIAFVLVRNAMIIVLAGTLPLSAAASSTEAGKAWFSKSTGWLLAFVLYKPAAAIVYAAAFASIGQTKTSDIFTQISGVVLLLLAAFTLPAMMKFVMPMVAATSGGTSAGAAVAGAGQAIATGAIAIKSLGASKAAAGTTGAAKGGQTSGAQLPPNRPGPPSGPPPPPPPPSGGGAPPPSNSGPHGNQGGQPPAPPTGPNSGGPRGSTPPPQAPRPRSASDRDDNQGVPHGSK
ncbi:hypothetical protein [Streptomyces sp. NBC_01431]|uniref:hypothetical protein n=1 Tax=Streptomyces sp. NBC_01431 TaxID=2903863 RepID=UPI002E379F0F|nr:hypothetical protein [Streptomyces sp. NBC_01431]